jgi:hypothetical protein
MNPNHWLGLDALLPKVMQRAGGRCIEGVLRKPWGLRVDLAMVLVGGLEMWEDGQ